MSLEKPSLHILPHGGFSREIKALAMALGYSEFNFYDDFKAGLKIEELPEKGVAVFATGNPKTRKKLLSKVSPSLQFPTLIHPSVILMEPKSYRLGRGCIIAAGSILTSNIEIGDFVNINLHCSIGHDCVLGDFASLMPGVRLSGGVILEESVYLGTNAVVLPNLKIGKNAIIGAGAVVTKDVPANTTVVGVPAKPLP
jgi:sugar O-acyltransferase (sialic acid O-acetyltransferase NeuD family)